jgi:hypothetical protein
VKQRGVEMRGVERDELEVRRRGGQRISLDEEQEEEDPKPEFRNPKEIRSPKSESGRAPPALRRPAGIRFSGFFRDSGFGVRISTGSSGCFSEP